MDAIRIISEYYTVDMRWIGRHALKESNVSKQERMIDFQYKLSFIIKICVVLVVSAVIYEIILKNFVSYQIDASSTYASARSTIKSVDDFLFPSLWFAVTIFTLLLSIGIAIISVFVSHKIAGPIYRLEVSLRDFKRGKFYKVHLRTKDQIKGLATLLNQFVEKLITQISTVKKKSLNLKGLIEESKKEITKGDIDFNKLKAINEAISSEIKNAKEAIGHYKT